MPENLLNPPLSDDVFFRCVEHCSEAIMITDSNGKLSYVNPAWVEIYGFSREDAIGESPRILHSGHHPDEFYREMWTTIRDPEIGVFKGELINRTKHGNLIPVFLTITPHRNQSGKIMGYMGIAIDRRDKKELEAKIFHQDRLASIGLLASGIAHEIGTPMGVIRGRAELMMSDKQEPETHKGLNVIITQIDRISKIIQSLLRVSRPVGAFVRTEIKLYPVIEEVTLLLNKMLASENILLEIEVDESVLVLGEPSRLEQVLLNLIMNSIHAIQVKPRSLHEKSVQKITISATNRKNKVAIEVSDTGIGISSENMKKLFNPFFTTKDVGQGTGLGLAIVLQFIREMGGEITAKSELQQGTTFTLVLDGAIAI